VKAIIPRFIADQSWPAILIVSLLAFVGGVALYSVAGASLTPWAMAHATRFAMFLIIALTLSYAPPAAFKAFTYPGLGNDRLQLLCS
jgi:rod shape determining protein RodA